MIFFFVITLECGFITIDQSYDHFTLAWYGLFLNNNVITVENSVFNHTLAFYLQDI